MKKVQQGFTLIELMIVVAIIGILAAIAIPQYSDYMTRTRLGKVAVAVASTKVAVAEYAQFNGGTVTLTAADNWLDPINSGGLGMAAAPTGTTEVSAIGVSTAGVITATLQGALVATGACGAGTSVIFTPSNTANQSAMTWTVTMGGTANRICTNEVAKWR